MKTYRIYVYGEETRFYCDAEDEKDAIENYKDDCIAEYLDKFGKEPDLDDFESAEIVAIEE